MADPVTGYRHFQPEPLIIEAIRERHAVCSSDCNVQAAIRRYDQAVREVLHYRDTEPRGGA